MQLNSDCYMPGTRDMPQVHQPLTFLQGGALGLLWEPWKTLLSGMCLGTQSCTKLQQAHQPLALLQGCGLGLFKGTLEHDRSRWLEQACQPRACGVRARIQAASLCPERVQVGGVRGAVMLLCIIRTGSPNEALEHDCLGPLKEARQSAACDICARVKAASLCPKHSHEGHVGGADLSRLVDTVFVAKCISACIWAQHTFIAAICM